MRRKKPRPRPKQYRPPPYGYVYQDGEYIPCEPACLVVQDVFTMFNNKETLTGIMWDLDNNEWPTAKGGKWTAQTIKGILSNRFYVDSDNPIVTDEVFNKAAGRLGKIKPGPQ